MSFNSARIKINQSSGQHDELQTAESPLKLVSTEIFAFCVGIKFLNIYWLSWEIKSVSGHYQYKKQ